MKQRSFASLSFESKKGLAVRAMVRTLDERATALSDMGAEVTVGDYADYGSLLGALHSIESAYFCYPVGAGIAEAAGLFATAGRKQGLKRIVDLSLAATRPDSPSPQGRAQRVAEQIFEWAGFEGVHLRIAAFFMENVTLMDGPSISTGGEIANAFGDLPLGWISGADVGQMAAQILANLGLVTERTIIAGGAEQLSYPDLAKIITDVVGKPVTYRELSPEEWRKRLVDASAAKGEANPRGADHLVAQSIALRKSPFMPVTDHVKRLTGHAPISFAQFVASRRDELTPQPHTDKLVGRP